MVFSDTTTKDGLIQDCELNVFGSYGEITGDSDRMYEFTARLNRALDKYDAKVKLVDGRFQKDDPNYTDLPIASANIVSGQKDYTMDIQFLDIEKVVLQDEAGNKLVLNPFDIQDPIAYSYLTNIGTVTGIPNWYDKTGDSLMLYPTPNYNKTLGLTVHYRRKPSYFVYTDTSKTPGVPWTLQRYISLEASLDYAISKQITKKKDLQVKVKEMEDLIEATFSARSRDESKRVVGVFRSAR